MYCYFPLVTNIDTINAAQIAKSMKCSTRSQFPFTVNLTLRVMMNLLDRKTSGAKNKTNSIQVLKIFN
jgi:hypothetical protein